MSSKGIIDAEMILKVSPSHPAIPPRDILTCPPDEGEADRQDDPEEEGSGEEGVKRAAQGLSTFPP